MSLTVGSKLGPYEIVSLLGAGGMGEVYRARDPRLGRDVAIKVLPQSVEADANQLRRFQQEAQLLASLNHPNIAALYGVEETAGSHALVMELVEGETLAERIAAGPMPPEDAVEIAKQVAIALEYAHEVGIVHRDLKPANIKLTPNGNVKVLDFGLAKALITGQASGSMQNSPTLSAMATKMGMILGTAAYMSPEQAKGKSVDRRSDIWSFGCVLFEMLSGKLTFGGETITDTLAAVVRGDPDWNSLPAATPAPLRKLIERCLRKEISQRPQAIGDVRIALDEFLSGETGGTTVPTQFAPVPKAAFWRTLLPWMAVAVLALTAVLLWHPWKMEPAKQVLRFLTQVGVEGKPFLSIGASTVLSPDGTHIVSVVLDDKQIRHLYLRAMDQTQTTLIPGTEDARNPFFSPDGKWIAFFTNNKLKKVPLTMGSISTICDVQDDRGGAWSEDGTIVFAPNSRSELFTVSSAGGTPVPLTKRQGKELTHRWPQFLPGGKALLYLSSDDGTNYDNADIMARVMATGETKKILRGGYYPQFFPGGFLTYVHEGSLFAARLNEKKLELESQPELLLPQVVANYTNGGAQISFARDGMAAYYSGKLNSDSPHLGWYTGSKFTVMRKEQNPLWSLAFSPDGKSVALAMEANGSQDIWIYDVQRETTTRLTFEHPTNQNPTWHPSGKYIAYTSSTAVDNNIWIRRADGAGTPQLLLKSDHRLGGMTWHPNGKLLVIAMQNPETDFDLMVLPVDGDEASGWKAGTPTPFLNTKAVEISPEFSPDGNWMAYVSTEAGEPMVFVRPFPGPGGHWLVTKGYGIMPHWSQTNHELFYSNISNLLFTVHYSTTKDSFNAETPKQFSTLPINANLGAFRSNYSLHPDGKRIAAMFTTVEDGEKNVPVTIVVNFAEEMKAKLAATKR